jgi:hypothetical protein
MHLILMLSLLTSSVAGSSNPEEVLCDAAGVVCVRRAAPASSPEACGETDLACVLKLLQQKAIEVESLTRQLAITKEQIRTSGELIEVWRAQAKVANDAAREAMAALKPSLAAWYQSPVLWTAVGLSIGVALAIGIVYALRPAFLLSP